MPSRLTQSPGLAPLFFLFALLAVGCSTTIEERNPALPGGFKEATLPDVDLRGYLYVSREKPLVAASDELIGGFAPSAEFPREVKLNKVAVWVSSRPRVYGMLYDFVDGDTARRLARELEKSDTEFRYRWRGNELYLFRGSGDWIEALRASIREERYVTLQDAYPDAWVLYNLLPEAPPGEPLAAGFGILDTDFLDRLARDVASELRTLRGFVKSAKLKNLVFGFYSSEPLTHLEELGHGTLSLGNPQQGVVMATRSSYPSFLVSFIFGSAASRASFQKVSFESSRGKEKAFYISPDEDFHAMIKNRGNIFTVSLSSEREKAEELMLEALGR